MVNEILIHNNIALPVYKRISLFLFCAVLSLSSSNAYAWSWFAFKIDKSTLRKVEKTFGTSAVDRLHSWESLVADNKKLPEEEQLVVVNDFFNKVPFRADWAKWHKKDYWATPVEFLAGNAGDCEDYSLAKYFTLRLMGVKEKRLRVTYVKALLINQAHMVLSYYKHSDSDPLILDNMNKEIKPGSERNDLKPVFTFNAKGLWLAKQKEQGRYIGGPERLSLWQDFNARLAKEGLD